MTTYRVKIYPILVDAEDEFDAEALAIDELLCGDFEIDSIEEIDGESIDDEDWG